MQQQFNPYFHMFEKRRIKVAEMHRSRREQIFNKSRQILQGQNQELNHEENYENDKNEKQEHQKDLYASIPQNQHHFFSIEENQINQKVQAISLCSKDTQETEMKEQGQLCKKKEKEKEKEKEKNNFYSESRKYVNMIQIPSWMNIVPEDLHNFYCCARPDGKVGLLIFKEGKATLFDKGGRKMNCNKNNLNKNYRSNLHPLSGTILEIVYVEATNTIYITDLLVWKNNLISSQNFQFRYAWLLSNAQTQLLNSLIFGNSLKLVQYYLMESQNNLKKVYFDQVGYEKQGLLFVNKQSPYIHGLNQNVMIWKDFKTSKYPINQDFSKTIKKNSQNLPEKLEQNKNYIYGMGKLSKSGSIYSLEGHKIGKSQQNLPGYIRYRILGITFNNQLKPQQAMQSQETNKRQMNIQLNEFEIVQYKKYHNGRVDSLSKIMFQYRMIYDPLTIEVIASTLPITQ